MTSYHIVKGHPASPFVCASAVRSTRTRTRILKIKNIMSLSTSTSTSSSSSTSRLSSGTPLIVHVIIQCSFVRGKHQSRSLKSNSSLLSELVNNSSYPSFSHRQRKSKYPILGDPALIHPFLAGLAKGRNTTREGESETDLGAAALHLAIRCASGAPLRSVLSPLSSSFFHSRNSLASALPQVYLTECCSPPSFGNNRTPPGRLAWSR